jgi:MFS family permease
MKAISKNIVFTGLTSFLTDTSTKMVYSVMPLFLMSIGASKTSLAVIEGIAESTAALVKTFSGFWSDKIGKNKPFMIIGYGLSCIIMPFYALVISPVQVLWLRFAERVGKGIRTAPRDSLIAGSVTNGETGTAFGIQKAMDNMGAILGPILAFLLLLLLPNNYRIIFLLAGIPALFGILTLVFGVKEAKKDRCMPIKWSGLKSFPKRYYIFLAIIFIFTLGNSTDALLLVKANEIGVKVALIPLVYLLTSVVSVALAVPMGILSDKIGKEKMLAVGYLLYAVVYFGFGWSSNVKTIMGLFALYGLYSAMTDGTQKAFVSDLVDANKKGTGLGIYNALIGLTLLPASLLAGILYDKVNANVPFYFGGAMSLLAAMMVFVLVLTDKRRLKTSWQELQKPPR